MQMIHYLGLDHKPWRKLYDATSGNVVNFSGNTSRTNELQARWWQVYLDKVHADLTTVNRVINGDYHMRKYAHIYIGIIVMQFLFDFPLYHVGLR